MALKHAIKIRALHRQQFLQCGAAVFFVVRKNHGAHVRNSFLAKEHVLSAAKADALGAECPRLNGVARNIRIGANANLAERLRPAHELLQLRIIRRRLQRVQLALDHAAGGAIERNPVALFEHLALHPHLARPSHRRRYRPRQPRSTCPCHA